jgi:hypothetical protein
MFQVLLSITWKVLRHKQPLEACSQSVFCNHLVTCIATNGQWDLASAGTLLDFGPQLAIAVRPGHLAVLLPHL